MSCPDKVPEFLNFMAGYGRVQYPDTIEAYTLALKVYLQGHNLDAAMIALHLCRGSIEPFGWWRDDARWQRENAVMTSPSSELRNWIKEISNETD